MRRLLVCVSGLAIIFAAVFAVAQQAATRPSSSSADFKRLLGDCARCHESECASLDAAVQGNWIKPGAPEGSMLYNQLADAGRWSPEMKQAVKLSDDDKKAVYGFIKSLKPADFAGKGPSSTGPVVALSPELEAKFHRVESACGQCHKVRHQAVDLAYRPGRIVPGDPESSRLYCQIKSHHMRGATHLTDADTQLVYDYIRALKPDALATTEAVETPTTTITSTGPVPPFQLRIHCGSAKDYTDGEGNVWKADRAYAKGGWGYEGGQAHQHPRDSTIQETKTPELYLWEHSDLERYRITVPAPGRYTVKLHFCENFDQVNSPGQRVFSILMGGKEVLKDLDVYKEAGYQAALVKTVQTDVTGGVLTIDFRKNSQWGPMINAIEVMSK